MSSFQTACQETLMSRVWFPMECEAQRMEGVRMSGGEGGGLIIFLIGFWNSVLCCFGDSPKAIGRHREKQLLCLDFLRKKTEVSLFFFSFFTHNHMPKHSESVRSVHLANAVAKTEMWAFSWRLWYEDVLLKLCMVVTLWSFTPSAMFWWPWPKVKFIEVSV